MSRCVLIRVLPFIACPSLILGITLHKPEGNVCAPGTAKPDIREPWGGTYTLQRPGAGPELVLVHVEKTGGSFAIDHVLNHASGRLHVVMESSAMPAEFLGDKFFRIGLIREPCDYYVSEFFWGVQGCGWLSKELDASGLLDRFYQGAESQQAQFKDWLYYISGLDRKVDSSQANASFSPSERCGLFSMRLWSQNLNEKAVKDMNNAYTSKHANPACAFMNEIDKQKGRPESPNGRCPCPLGNCAAVASAQHHNTCKQEMIASNLAKFDCWIRTDHADADMSECMQKYAERGGNVTIARPSDGPGNRNHDDGRASCESMFDAESEQLVNSIDGELRSLFGYSRCCKPHLADKMPQF